MKHKSHPIMYEDVMITLIGIGICVILYGAIRWYFFPVDICSVAFDHIRVQYEGSSASVYCDGSFIFQTGHVLTLPTSTPPVE